MLLNGPLIQYFSGFQQHFRSSESHRTDALLQQGISCRSMQIDGELQCGERFQTLRQQSGHHARQYIPHTCATQAGIARSVDAPFLARPGANAAGTLEYHPGAIFFGQLQGSGRTIVLDGASHQATARRRR